jgi:hypothetical protein
LPRKARPHRVSEQDVADELHACYAPHAQPIVTVLGGGCCIAEALRLKLPGDISRAAPDLHDTKTATAGVVPMHERTVAALRLSRRPPTRPGV